MKAVLPGGQLEGRRISGDPLVEPRPGLQLPGFDPPCP
jgi:hypothetical protein